MSSRSGSGVVLGLPDRGHLVVVRRLHPRRFGKRHRPLRLPRLWRRSTCRPAGERLSHRGLNHPQLFKLDYYISFHIIILISQGTV